MILYVKVKPKSREEKIEKLLDCSYVISVREKAENGKANVRIVKILAKEFGVSSKEIVIKNPSSRKKIIEVQGK